MSKPYGNPKRLIKAPTCIVFKNTRGKSTIPLVLRFVRKSPIWFIATKAFGK